MTDPDRTGSVACERFSELAPELALGTLNGRDRADAVDHLHACVRCQRTVGCYNELADGLLELVPATEPPAGFETRVLAAIASSRAAMAHHQAPDAVETPSARRTTGGGARAGRAAFAAVAAAAVAVAIGLAGYGLGHRGHGDEPLRTATLVAAGHQVGAAYLYGGNQPWIYMGLATGHADETVTCQLERGAGRGVTSIGTFTLVAGHGSWGARAPGGVAGVTGARLIDSTGATVAEGTFGH